MGRRLARNLGPVGHLLPGQWTDATASGDPAVACPSCGEVSDLNLATHEIFRDGTVAPIWSCPCEGCPCIEYLSLEAWLEEVLR